MTEATVHVHLFLDVPAELAHEARVMVIRRGGEGTIRGAMLEGLRLWVEKAHEEPAAGATSGGGPAEIGAAMTHVYFYADAPAGLVDQVRALAALRGPAFGFEGAIVEGLRLWVARERERPRPVINDALFKESLRLTCCHLLAHSFTQLHDVIGPGGRLVKDGALLRRGKEAAYWIGLDDLEHPLSYLNCCAFLDVDAARGRSWARPYAQALARVALDLDAIERQRAKLRERKPARAAVDDDGGEGALYLTESEEKRFKEIMGDRKEYFRKTMNAVRGFRAQGAKVAEVIPAGENPEGGLIAV